MPLAAASAPTCHLKLQNRLFLVARPSETPAPLRLGLSRCIVDAVVSAEVMVALIKRECWVNGLEYNEDQRYLLSTLVWRLATEVGCPRIESSFNRENSPKLVAIK